MLIFSPETTNGLNLYTSYFPALFHVLEELAMILDRLEDHLTLVVTVGHTVICIDYCRDK